jgi:hypothetical protein
VHDGLRAGEREERRERRQLDAVLATGAVVARGAIRGPAEERSPRRLPDECREAAADAPRTELLAGSREARLGFAKETRGIALPPAATAPRASEITAAQRRWRQRAAAPSARASSSSAVSRRPVPAQAAAAGAA